ncbi:MAG TPA: F0F1 ATP synthase subunit gamma, partial [Rhodothermales bacterium]
MASLRDIRTRINAVKNTQQVTRAMKMVAASKLRRAQEQIFRTRPYAYKIGEIINHLKTQVDPSLHPLFQAREDPQSVLLVIVTADRGLAGAFNANIIRLAEQTIRSEYETKRAAGKLYLMGLGRKGKEYFARRDFQMVGDYRGIYDPVSIQTVQEIVSEIVDGYVEGKWDEVRIVYNE